MRFNSGRKDRDTTVTAIYTIYEEETKTFNKRDDPKLYDPEDTDDEEDEEEEADDEDEEETEDEDTEEENEEDGEEENEDSDENEDDEADKEESSLLEKYLPIIGASAGVTAFILCCFSIIFYFIYRHIRSNEDKNDRRESYREPV